jgi:hypothetical protein
MCRKKLSPANYDTVKAAIAKGIVAIPDAAPASALKLKKPVLSSATPYNLHQEENPPRSATTKILFSLSLSRALLLVRSRRLSLPVNRIGVGHRGIVHSKGNEGDVIKDERKHPKRKKGPKGGALEEKRYYIIVWFRCRRHITVPICSLHRIA